MQRMTIIIAGVLACGAAVAGPKDPASVGSSQKKVSVKPALPGANPEVLGWIDTFDTYTTGSGLNGQGGWVPWYGTGAQGFLVSSPAAHSAPNSLEYNINLNDCVQQLGYQNNVFVYRCWVYVDSLAFGDGYVIGLNDYQHVAGAAQWSMQVKFSGIFGTVSNDAAGWGSAPILPIVFDQWVEFFAIIDLVNDSYRDYYRGQLLSDTMPTGEPLTWTGAPDPVTGGQTNALIDPLAPEFAVFAANDLYSDGIELMYIDEPQLVCYADMDHTTGVGMLDLFDFLAFQNRFVQNDILACDCDLSTGPATCDLFDFLCFQNRFVAGCN